MRLNRFADARDYLGAAETFLVQNEVHNCLPLGLAAQLIEHPERIQTQPYMAAVEERGRVIAAAMMTLPGRLIMALTDSRDAVGVIAADARVFSPSLSSVIGPVPVTRWFAEQWRELTGDPFQGGMSERLYQLTRVNAPAGVPGRARLATEADRDLLIKWVGAFEEEAFGSPQGDPSERVDAILAIRSRGIYIWEDGQPASIAGYGGRTPHGIRIGPVYTPPALRGHGYASACVARLSQDQLDAGRQFCCLYTDLANPTSNHIYQVIGYEPVCDVQEYVFSAAAS